MKRIPIAIKLQEVSSEITYQLPTESSPQFKNFFRDLDASLNDLGLRSYSVGVTTLEEVFLKIGHGEEVEQKRDQDNMNLRAQGEKLQNVKPEDQEIEDYSIGTDQRSSFFDQLFNLSKAQLLRQFRDR